MKSMENLRLLSLLAAGLTVGCTSDSPLGVRSPENTSGIEASAGLGNDGMVPFKAVSEFGGNLDVSGVVCGPGESPFRHSIHGNATHLGRFTGEEWGCLRFLGFPNGKPTLGNTRGGTVLVAANGDELWLQLDPVLLGTSVFTPPTVTTSVANVISGGTGRFEGATGNLQFYVSRDIAETPPGSLDGAISIPRSH